MTTVGIWGRSMGAATALLYSHIDPSIAGMLLDSPYRHAHKHTLTTISLSLPLSLSLALSQCTPMFVCAAVQ